MCLFFDLVDKESFEDEIICLFVVNFVFLFGLIVVWWGYGFDDVILIIEWVFILGGGLFFVLIVWVMGRLIIVVVCMCGWFSFFELYGFLLVIGW